MYTVRYLYRNLALLLLYWSAVSWAYVVDHDAKWMDKEQNSTVIEIRAPNIPGAITIPLFQQTEHKTWTGFRIVPGLFGSTPSDAAIRETARKTYESIANNIPWDMQTVLLAVVHIPGSGWAAGTIWQGSSAAFQTFASGQTSFWNSVPGDMQGSPSWAENTHPWHAEAVAVAESEKQFGERIKDGKWPEKTRIFVFGKEGGGAAGPKAVCVPGHTSVMVSCGEWLERLGISVVSKK